MSLWWFWTGFDLKLEQPSARTQLPHWEKLLPALIVIVAVSVASVFLMQTLGGIEKIRAWVVGAGAWGPVVFILLKASTYVIAPLSGTPLKLVAGALFGVWDGLFYAMLGDILGGSLNFWIARFLGRPGIRRFAGPKAIKQVDDTLEHVGGWKALLFARLILSSLYDFISYAAGLSNLAFRHYLWVTVVGGIPQALLFVVIGDALVSGPGMLYMLLGLVCLVGLGLWLRKSKVKKPSK